MTKVEAPPYCPRDVVAVELGWRESETEDKETMQALQFHASTYPAVLVSIKTRDLCTALAPQGLLQPWVDLLPQDLQLPRGHAKIWDWLLHPAHLKLLLLCRHVGNPLDPRPLLRLAPTAVRNIGGGVSRGQRGRVAGTISCAQGGAPRRACDPAGVVDFRGPNSVDLMLLSSPLTYQIWLEGGFIQNESVAKVAVREHWLYVELSMGSNASRALLLCRERVSLG